MTNVRCPIDGQWRLDAVENFRVGAFARIQPCANIGDEVIAESRRDHAIGGEPIGVQLARARMLRNLLVHQRLRDKRFVLLIVAELPETHHVDDDILVEFHPVFERDTAHGQHRFRIVRVHMEYGCFDHLGDVGAVQGRTRIACVGGGESDLIIDHDMHRAAGLETARL